MKKNYTVDFPDIFKNLKRGPQIITLKDMALISAYTGISSGQKIVDAGSGSGFLAIYLGNLVKPDGKVISYEIRKDFAEIAKQNVKKAGLEKVVRIKNKDVSKGIEEKNVDVITLDLPEPWKVVKNAKKSLKKGGWIVSYVPNIEQVKKMVEECEKQRIKHVHTIESFIREIIVRKKGTRPENTGIIHTGYISFFRRN
jgi:tRNA (adenine57-N1/adenine58-N1)-methyltransferase